MASRVTLGRLAQRLERLVHTEEVGGSNPPSPTIPAAARVFFTTENHRAEVAKRQTRCVQGAVSFRTCGFKSLPRHHFPTRACSSVDRALPCGGRGREFESRQARHFFALAKDHGRLAQMVRASALHAEGRGFESLTAHQTPMNSINPKWSDVLGRRRFDGMKYVGGIEASIAA